MNSSRPMSAREITCHKETISTVIKIRLSLEPLVDGQPRFFSCGRGGRGVGVFAVALTLYSYFNYIVQGVT